jgi:hypothetical protein
MINDRMRQMPRPGRINGVGVRPYLIERGQNLDLSADGGAPRAPKAEKGRAQFDLGILHGRTRIARTSQGCAAGGNGLGCSPCNSRVASIVLDHGDPELRVEPHDFRTDVATLVDRLASIALSRLEVSLAPRKCPSRPHRWGCPRGRVAADIMDTSPWSAGSVGQHPY